MVFLAVAARVSLGGRSQDWHLVVVVGCRILFGSVAVPFERLLLLLLGRSLAQGGSKVV